MSYILIFKQVLLGTPKEMHKEQKEENATRSNLDSMVVVQWLCDGVISSAGRKMDLPVSVKTVNICKKVVSCMMVPLLLGYKLKMLAIAHFNFISESSLKKPTQRIF